VSQSRERRDDDLDRTAWEALVHDLANVLTPLHGWAELVAERSSDQVTRCHTERILAAATAAEAIVATMARTRRRDPALAGESDGDAEPPAEPPVVVLLFDDRDTADELEELLIASSCVTVHPNDVVEAEHLLRARDSRVRLLVVGEELIGPASREVLAHARAASPRIPVIVTTRHRESIACDDDDGHVRCPLDRPVFTRLVDELLGRAASLG
jgi:hypothetical protein